MMIPRKRPSERGMFLKSLLKFTVFSLKSNFTVEYSLGETGVGKSVVVRDLLEKLAVNKNYLPVYMNFSAQTSSIRTQELIESRLEKKGRNCIGKSLVTKASQSAFYVDIYYTKLNVRKRGGFVELFLLQQIFLYFLAYIIFIFCTSQDSGVEA